MKRKLWWTLLGLPGVGLAAALVGQSVWGQPDVSRPVFPDVPMIEPLLQPKDSAPGGIETVPIEHVPAPNSISPPLSAPALPQTTQSSPVPNMRSETVVPYTPPAVKRNDALPHDITPGKQQPSVLVEWSGPPSIRINQPMNCQLIVRNTSGSPAHNVIIRHRPGQGVTCKSMEPQAMNEGGELIWQLGTLAPEQTRKIDMVLVSSARGTLNCSAAVTFTAVTAHHVQVREPMLAIKMRAPEKVIAGENVTLLYTISNPGDGATEAIKVQTTLPDGLEHARGSNIEFDVGTLAPKEARTMQLVCLAKGNGLQKCSSVASADGILTSKDATQFEILTPKLDVAMSGPKLRYLDRRAVYTVRITNPGSAPASNVEVQEIIPPGFKFHQANHGGKFHEGTRLVTWNLGELSAGQSKDVTVDLVPIQLGDHRITAHVKAARGLKSEVETHTLVEGLSSLAIDVSHVDDPIEVGAETAFEIRVANTGTKTETNVQVVCTLPEQLAFKGAKCSTTLRYRQEGTQLIFEPLTKLTPKADVIYRVQVRGMGPGDVRFRTQVNADGLKDAMQREESIRVYSDGTPIKAPPSNTPAPYVPAPNVVVPSVPAPSVAPPPPLSGPTDAVPVPKANAPMLPERQSQPVDAVPRTISSGVKTAPTPAPVTLPATPPLPELPAIDGPPPPILPRSEAPALPAPAPTLPPALPSTPLELPMLPR
jgi:hypothetical protein